MDTRLKQTTISAANATRDFAKFKMDFSKEFNTYFNSDVDALFEKIGSTEAKSTNGRRKPSPKPCALCVEVAGNEERPPQEAQVWRPHKINRSRHREGVRC